MDGDLVGVMLEVRWRYFVAKEPYYIWAAGEVVQVTDGVLKESPRHKKPLAAGAVRIKWPADPKRGEPVETYSWVALHPDDWGKNRHLSWRYDDSCLAAELEKRARVCGKS